MYSPQGHCPEIQITLHLYYLCILLNVMRSMLMCVVRTLEGINREEDGHEYEWKEQKQPPTNALRAKATCPRHLEAPHPDQSLLDLFPARRTWDALIGVLDVVVEGAKLFSHRGPGSEAFGDSKLSLQKRLAD